MAKQTEILLWFPSPEGGGYGIGTTVRRVPQVGECVVIKDSSLGSLSTYWYEVTLHEIETNGTLQVHLKMSAEPTYLIRETAGSGLVHV